MNKTAEVLSKLGELFKDADPIKVIITLDMILAATEFVQEAWKDLNGQNPTLEQQLMIYEKYDKLFIDQKKTMKDNIAKTKV